MGSQVMSPRESPCSDAESAALSIQSHTACSLFEGLDDKARTAFTVLPYLLHVNEPDLPGYVSSRSTTHGVSHFEFNQTIESALNSLIRRRTFRVPANEFRSVIRSIFIVSDIGTIAQRTGDKVTMYLVVDLRGMGESVRRQLNRKLEELASWSHQRGLFIDFELVDPSWSCDGDFGRLRGQRAIGMLLLERFYRSAIYIAGELPIYWCTTPGGGTEKHAKTARLAARMDFDESMASWIWAMLSFHN